MHTTNLTSTLSSPRRATKAALVSRAFVLVLGIAAGTWVVAGARPTRAEVPNDPCVPAAAAPREEPIASSAERAPLTRGAFDAASESPRVAGHGAPVDQVGSRCVQMPDDADEGPPGAELSTAPLYTSGCHWFGGYPIDPFAELRLRAEARRGGGTVQPERDRPRSR
jgi:hypothetical protein